MNRPSPKLTGSFFNAGPGLSQLRKKAKAGHPGTELTAPQNSEKSISYSKVDSAVTQFGELVSARVFETESREADSQKISDSTNISLKEGGCERATPCVYGQSNKKGGWNCCKMV